MLKLFTLSCGLDSRTCSVEFSLKYSKLTHADRTSTDASGNSPCKMSQNSPLRLLLKSKEMGLVAWQ